MTLDHIVPWGRSFEEYQGMFDLSEEDLKSRILGCADGPASFNAEATRRGAKIISCDPLYRCEASQILDRISTTFDEVLRNTYDSRGQFVWNRFRSLEELGRARMKAMNMFLEDFELGRSQGRYVAAELPALPFRDGSFDLAVCSHLLFLYTDELDEAFHKTAILEMCRLAPEVRIFPLLALDGQPSKHLSEVESQVRGRGFEVAVETVPYEFQRRSNRMMRIRSL